MPCARTVRAHTHTHAIQKGHVVKRILRAQPEENTQLPRNREGKTTVPTNHSHPTHKTHDIWGFPPCNGNTYTHIHMHTYTLKDRCDHAYAGICISLLCILLHSSGRAKWNAAPGFRLSFEKQNKETTLRLFFTEPGQKKMRNAQQFSILCVVCGAPVSELVLAL